MIDTTMASLRSLEQADSEQVRNRGVRRRSHRLAAVAAHAPLIIWGAVVSLPLLWMFVSSLKTDREIISIPFGLPAAAQWENFGRAWTNANIGSYFVNTLLVVTGGVALTLLCSAMAAYVIAKFRFVGSQFVYWLFAASMTFPVFLGLVPLFFVASNLGLTNSIAGLILVYAAYSLPFTIFFLMPFFKEIPTEFAEAARIDGAGEIRLFFTIMVPLAKPGLVSMAIFNFLSQWNQYLLPLILVTDEKKFVISQGLVNIAVNQGYQSDWGALFAGLSIATMPVLVTYLIFQRRIQSGLTIGGLK